jgi:hypothetical protein
MKKAARKLYTLFIRVPDGTGDLKLFPKTDKVKNGRIVFKFKLMRYGEAMQAVADYEDSGHSVWLWQGHDNYHLIYNSKDTNRTGQIKEEKTI